MTNRSLKYVATAVLSSAIGLAPAIAETVETKVLEVNGKQIPYTEAGTGPLMVFLHGGLSNHRAVDDHVKALSKDFRVVAFPHRFYGDGAWGELPDGGRYFEQAAADTAAFINALNVGPAHIVGWSHGSRVGHITALNHPDQVKSAYLFEGTIWLKMGEADQKEMGSRLAPIMGPFNKAFKDGTMKEFTTTLWEIIVDKKGAYNELPDDWKQMFTKFSPSLKKAWGSKRPDPVACETMRTHKVPMLLVKGDKSAPLFQVMLDDKHWSQCMDMMTVKGATHMWPRVGFDAFVQSVASFAKKHTKE